MATSSQGFSSLAVFLSLQGPVPMEDEVVYFILFYFLC